MNTDEAIDAQILEWAALLSTLRECPAARVEVRPFRGRGSTHAREDEQTAVVVTSTGHDWVHWAYDPKGQNLVCLKGCGATAEDARKALRAAAETAVRARIAGLCAAVETLTAQAWIRMQEATAIRAEVAEVAAAMEKLVTRASSPATKNPKETPMDLSLVVAAFAAQATAQAALQALGAAHDGVGCAAVRDHCGKPWGFVAKSGRYDGSVYTYREGHAPDYVMLAHDKADGEAGVYVPIVHGDVTLVRERDSWCGDTLHVFSTALRNDAPAEAYVAEGRAAIEAGREAPTPAPVAEEARDVPRRPVG